MQQFDQNVHNGLSGLSRMLEVTLQTELHLTISPILSQRVRQRIQRLSELLSEEERVLRQLLQPFPYVLALPDVPSHDDHGDDDDHGNGPNTASTDAADSPHHPPFRHNNVPDGAQSPYDTTQQIVAHIVRDWTRLGAPIRASLYEWIGTQLDRWIPGPRRTLIPGAGLGRLSYNLAQQGYTVEANELSINMVAVAYQILIGMNANDRTTTIHPFLMDYFVNEVESQDRYEAVTIERPHADVSGSLSYTVGSFTDIYRTRYEEYDAVVTSFFLDCSSNVLETMAILTNSLKSPSGVWVFVGPLQWHSNAHLHISVDELKELVVGFGFRIQHWSVDTVPMDYRAAQGPAKVRSTKFEGYQVLRFVAVKTRRTRIPLFSGTEENSDGPFPSAPLPTTPQSSHPTIDEVR